MFQVLISIQSLILCAEPYYNEPGFERLYGTPQGDAESLKYSEEVFRNNLKYAVAGQLTNPPEGFEDVVRAHFYLKRDVLLEVSFLKSYKLLGFNVYCFLCQTQIQTIEYGLNDTIQLNDKKERNYIHSHLTHLSPLI